MGFVNEFEFATEVLSHRLDKNGAQIVEPTAIVGEGEPGNLSAALGKQGVAVAVLRVVAPAHEGEKLVELLARVVGTLKEEAEIVAECCHDELGNRGSIVGSGLPDECCAA